MSNYLPQKINTEIKLNQDTATKANQQVTTIMPSGTVLLDGFTLNNRGYTDNFGDVQNGDSNAGIYKIQTLATLGSLANRQVIVHNKKQGTFYVGSIDDNSYNVNSNRFINWRGFKSGKYSLVNEGDMQLGVGENETIYNNGFWLNNANVYIGNGPYTSSYEEGPGGNIGIDNQEGGTIYFNGTPITLGVNSGRWYNEGTIQSPGNITTLDATGLEEGIPMIINDHLISFTYIAENYVPTVNAIIYNRGMQGDGSGIQGVVTFIAPIDDEGNLLPGFGHEEYGTITFQKRYQASGVGSGGVGKAHEFHLSSDISNYGDKLVSLQGIDLEDVRVLNVNYDKTPVANRKYTLFQSKPGTGNTTGNYNDSNLNAYKEGDQIPYTTMEGSKNIPIFITYFGGAGSDIELYGSNYNYDKGTDNPDTLTGTSGSDTYQGLGGNDTLISSGGVDDAYGGTGSDNFVLKKGDGHMAIQDFNPSEDMYSSQDGSAISVVSSGDDSQLYMGSDLVGTIVKYNING